MGSLLLSQPMRRESPVTAEAIVNIAESDGAQVRIEGVCCTQVFLFYLQPFEPLEIKIPFDPFFVFT